MARSGASHNAATAMASHGRGRHSTTAVCKCQAHSLLVGQHLSALLKSLLVVVSLVSVTHPDCPQGENPVCLHAPLRPVLAPGCQTPDLGRLKGDRAKPWSKYIASDVVQALLVRLSSNFSNSEEKASCINQAISVQTERTENSVQRHCKKTHCYSVWDRCSYNHSSTKQRALRLRAGGINFTRVQTIHSLDIIKTA